MGWPSALLQPPAVWQACLFIYQTSNLKMHYSICGMSVLCKPCWCGLSFSAGVQMFQHANGRGWTKHPCVSTHHRAGVGGSLSEKYILYQQGFWGLLHTVTHFETYPFVHKKFCSCSDREVAGHSE